MPDPEPDLILDSPLGRLAIALQGEQVAAVAYRPRARRTRAADTALARRIGAQFAAYFRDGSFHFTLPVTTGGTPFQQRVWRALAEIPPGEVRTYGELAVALGSGARAVGSACRSNPLPVIIPCHRVVAAAGLGGYAGHTRGAGLARKRWLLAHEARATGGALKFA
jgi:methylated-DNA-[protein]-cysteine S-methyltransferase